MDNWEKSLRGDRSRSNSRKNGNGNPSFSSTLLDAIYRSIDEGDAEAGELVMYKETMRKKQSRSSNCGGIMKEYEERERRSYHHRTEKWTTTTEKKASEKVNSSTITTTIRRASDYDRFHLMKQSINPVGFHSASSSSDSSYGGFSSSEAESVYGGRRASVLTTAQRPKPVRTSPAPVRTEPPLQKKPQTQTTLEKSKGRSSPLSYSDLKKAKKLPVSPGAKLASFLNSLFAATGAAKKAKLSSSFNGDDYRSSSERKSKSTQATSSTCSTASSYSRSCLSKTPSSRGKSVNGVKRSVRFYPVSVIVDEDCRPCGQKSLYEDERSLAAVREAGDSELKFHIMEKNKRVEEAAKKFLNGSYQTKGDFLMRDLQVDHDEDDEDDEDDDAASDSSSDLFELENLTAVGIERYREELPVYETTHLDTNRAIASGLIL